jgi:hypothetical protein
MENQSFLIDQKGERWRTNKSGAHLRGSVLTFGVFTG